MPAAAAGIRLRIKPKQRNELGNPFFGDVPEMGTRGLKELPKKQDEYCKGDSLFGPVSNRPGFSWARLTSATALHGWTPAPPIPATFPRIGLTAGHKPATDGIEGISGEPTSGFQNPASETAALTHLGSNGGSLGHVAFHV